MQLLARAIYQLSTSSRATQLKRITNSVAYNILLNNRFLSTKGGNDGELNWGSESSWSSGLTKDHFDGEVVGQKVGDTDGGLDDGVGGGGVDFSSSHEDDFDDLSRLAAKAARDRDEFANKWKERMLETSFYLKQVIEPGARGAYLKDSEKAEMYRLHKENPQVYTVEKLAKDYRILRQRVHAILWLKEDEEKMEKELGRPLDDSVEKLLDLCPEFFPSHDREFHVASLPYKPDFKVMPEGWDGTVKDLDEVLYEISVKEDQILYEEFVRRFNFNIMKREGKVKVHKYSRRRPPEGWEFTVEKMGPHGKRGNGGGWKFKSLPDGSTRPLNDYEKVFVDLEKPRRRRRILHQK